jgi:3'(2'), 5'-bisphosphate nucleotidase
METELISLAVRAGNAVREVYLRGTWKTSLKHDQSPLTDADRASHSILTESLSRIAPEIPILSEEAAEVPFEVRSKWDSYFLIDPLDGTREFVAKIPEFAINIALIKKGHPIIGVIHSPLEQSTYFAEAGKGAFKIMNERQSLPLEFSQADGIKVLLSHTDKTPDLDVLINKLPSAEIVRMGSSLKFCRVAEGRADFYPRLKPSMEWDTAAGTILVEEAGGTVCQLSGERIDYNRQDMLNPPFYVVGKSLVQKMPDWQKVFLRKGEF